ncbi:hypothetical protein G5T42_10260 [Microbacterium sp. 4R-513]|uniref:hypothetical protein n=1 Tax=Microbacterium sp. 4R-513 TaxID=2567934 RepID=UPI0013E2040B|nr:hypothetical protein [Microbacterium sp. 4R-513]QIG39818.1 hypothetical protein G5T42_10260 [Microbacterium sp. 4R-513]
MAITQQRLDDLWDFSDAAGSETRLRLAADAEADASARAELETQVGRALGLQGKFDDAEGVLDAIASYAPEVRTRVALERGRLRNSAGDVVAAVPLFREAAEAAASARLDFLLVDALHMLAIADPANGAQWTDRALAHLDGVDDPRTLRWRVGLHSNRGWALFDGGDVVSAIAEFERAKDAAVRWGTEQQVEWADEALAEARASLDAYGR